MVKDFDKSLAESYIDDIENCRIYQHDETHVFNAILYEYITISFYNTAQKCIGGITESLNIYHHSVWVNQSNESGSRNNFGCRNPIIIGLF